MAPLNQNLGKALVVAIIVYCMLRMALYLLLQWMEINHQWFIELPGVYGTLVVLVHLIPLGCAWIEYKLSRKATTKNS